MNQKTNINEKDMNNRIAHTLAALAVAAAFFTGCSKEGPGRFEGNYSFNTSGTLTLVPQGSGADTGESGSGDTGGTGGTDNSLTVSIPSEGGQMDIVTADKKEGNMIVTMRPLGGGVQVFDAVADGKTITLQPLARVLEISWNGSVLPQTAMANVSVSGYGERYSDVIIFRLDYTGTCTAPDGTVYDITESRVDCVAKEND